MPPQEQPGPFALLEMIMGSMVTQAIHVAARLGFADLLAGGPRTADDVAARAGADPDATARLLRALASFSIFTEEDGRFGLTPVGEALCSDAPFSVRDMALLMGHPFQWEDWGHLIDAIRTGEPVLPTFRKMGGYEFLEANPEFAKVFEGGMGTLSRMENEPIADAYDFSPFGTIVDVFGGQGALLTAILRRATGARGVLCDARAEQLGAAAAFAEAGLADRCEVELGGFFDKPPGGGDAYLLKHIVHEWPEPQALEILRNVREAIKDDGRLLLMEFVLPDGSEPHPGRLVDLWLMVLMGGKERTAAQYADLLARAGFRFERVVPTAAGVAIVEAVPV
ncbi:methyltransferase [Actinomadura luteofluorescens]|uniref:methyltransferase n=1 Tax=Actinomadura luteofluorescens TaxID=46163 RepID=UPI003490EA36